MCIKASDSIATYMPNPINRSLKKLAVSNWIWKAEDWELWRKLDEAFVQQWPKNR